MSMRGTKALREGQWRRSQRQDGYRAGLEDKPGLYADQYYQAGYRAGVARRALRKTTPRCSERKTMGGAAWQCPHLARSEYPLTGTDNEWWPVCGVHAAVVRRRGYVTRPLVRRLR